MLHMLLNNNNNNYNPVNSPLSGVCGRYSVRRPYHYLMEIERLFPKEPRLKIVSYYKIYGRTVHIHMLKCRFLVMF